MQVGGRYSVMNVASSRLVGDILELVGDILS